MITDAFFVRLLLTALRVHSWYVSFHLTFCFPWGSLSLDHKRGAGILGGVQHGFTWRGVVRAGIGGLASGRSCSRDPSIAGLAANRPRAFFGLESHLFIGPPVSCRPQAELLQPCHQTAAVRYQGGDSGLLVHTC